MMLNDRLVSNVHLRARSISRVAHAAQASSRWHPRCSQPKKEVPMANKRKPTVQLPDPTSVADTAIDAGVRAVEMTTAVARGFAKSALAAARAMSETFAQAAEETTRAATNLARDGVERKKRVAPRAEPRPRRASRKAQSKTQNRRRRAA
jgi:hypothetical protein